jgi:hypothetical protein
MQHQLPQFNLQAVLAVLSIFASVGSVFIRTNGISWDFAGYLWPLSLLTFYFGILLSLIAVVSTSIKIKQLKSSSIEVQNIIKVMPSQNDRIKLESFFGIQRIILRRSVRAIIFIGMIFFLATIFSITFITKKGYSPFYLLGFVVLINISVISFCSYISSMSRTDYRQIPHAVDGRGAHRCIFCGNRGIYKHGQYKSNSTWHDCSSCGENLYMS